MKFVLRSFLVSICLIGNPLHAMDFTETAECDLKFLNFALTFIEEDCPAPDSGINWFLCSKKVHEMTIPKLCSPMAKKHLQNQLFFDEEYLTVMKLFQEKKISSSEYQKKVKLIENLSKKEVKDFYRQYESALERQKNISANRVAELQGFSDVLKTDILRADNYRTSVIPMGIAILNGPSLYQSKDPRIETYTINGRFITCTTMSGFTNCN